MDKIFERVKSAFIDTGEKSPDYRLSYANSKDEIIKIFSNYLIIQTSESTIYIPWNEISGISFPTDVISSEVKKIVSISWGRNVVNIEVDTFSENFMDIFPIYRYLYRRWRSSGASRAQKMIKDP